VQAFINLLQRPLGCHVLAADYSGSASDREMGFDIVP
jgi:hypothetical protein